MDFNAPWEILNPMSKAVLSEFDRCGWHSKQSCLQGWANFHRSQAWQIVLICNTSSVLIQVMTWSHYLKLILTQFTDAWMCHQDRGSDTIGCLWSWSSLTHLPLDKIDAFPQTILLDAFSWMKSFVFWLKFHWSLFLNVQLTMTQH